MNRVLAITVCLVAGLAAAEGKPKITERTGVRTLASVEDRSLLARGSVFEVTGEDLGPAEVAAGEVPYPQEWAGVKVQLTSVASAGEVVSAFVVSASAGRVVAILPSTAAVGDYRVTATVNGEASNAFAVKIVERNFGLVTNTGGFGGAVRGRILAEGAEPAAMTLANAAAPGAVIEMDATGLGAIEGADNDFPAEANAVPEAVLVIGGQEAAVTYLGRNPLRPGYDKLVVTLPAENLPASCVALLKVKIGEAETLSVSIPLLGPEETACKHPMGFSPETLTNLANGGSIIRAGFTLVRLWGQTKAGGMTFESKVDQFSGGFVRFTADDVAMMTAGSLLAGAYDENRCVVYDGLEGSTGGVYVDAGPELQIQGPTWSAKAPRGTAATSGPNIYGLTLDSKFNGAVIPGLPNLGLLIQPGKHTLSGPGGAVVGPFSVDLDVSTQFLWPGMGALAEIDTSQDLTFEYSGGGVEDIMTASGLVRGPAPEAPSKIVSRVWVCQAKGSEGRMVVPAYVLQKLPKVSAAELANAASGRYSSVSLASYNPTGAGEFRAPLTEGGMSELTVFIFSYVYSKAPVPVR
jgi:uncharacterized protein (TIGR03437 family)